MIVGVLKEIKTEENSSSTSGNYLSRDLYNPWLSSR